MKKLLFFALGLIAIALCTLTSCEMEKKVLEEIIGEDVRSFDYERLQEAGKGWIVVSSGDSICGMTATLEHPEETVAPENLGRVTYTPMGDVRQVTKNGILHVYRDFLGSDGNVMHAEAWAPETLAEKAGILGYVESYGLIADPVEVVDMAENRATLKAVASMVFYRDSKEVGRVSVKPNYYHVTVKPDKPDEPEPHTPVIKVDTTYFWIGLDAFLKFRGTIDGVVFHEKVYPIASTGTFNGTDLWRLEAPARFDTSVGNNGLETSVEPQPGLSYTDQKVDEYTKATKECGYFHVKSTFIGDGQGTTTTECGIVYWTMSYTITEPTTGWSMSTHPIELTHEVTRNELTIVDGSRNDKYGKPHHHIGDLTTELTSYLIINNEKHVFTVSSDVSHLCEWAQP